MEANVLYKYTEFVWKADRNVIPWRYMLHIPLLRTPVSFQLVALSDS